MEMKIVIDREGCEAKNLLVYQLCEKTSVELSKCNSKTPINILQKPPVGSSKTSKITSSNSSLTVQSPVRIFNGINPNRRVRSASTGRDKKSELQARYWALLFGNLQRAVNEIYQTVESYENISSCQEAILVLENYVRDFKALSEWFKVSWDYESRPIQQRPQSLAWEIRKSNPVPRIRAKSLSSPTISGKSSPNCMHTSGKSSPCCNFEMFSNRKCLGQHEQLPKGRMRFNVRELFSTNKNQIVEGEQLNDYVVENRKLLDGSKYDNDFILINKQTDECESRKFVQEQFQRNHTEDKLVKSENINKCNQFSQTDLEDDHLTLADIREKFRQKEQINYSAQAQQNSNLVTSEINQISSVISDFNNIENLCEKITHVDTDILTKTENVSEKRAENDKKNPLMEIPNCPLKYSSVLNPSEEENMKNVRCSSKTSVLSKSSMEKRVLNTNLNRSSVIKSIDIPSNVRSSYLSSTAKSKSQNRSINNHGSPNNFDSRISFRSKTLLEMKTGSKTINPVVQTQIGSSNKKIIT